MTDIPNCSNCINDDCPIHPNGLPFPEEVRYEINVIRDHAGRYGGPAKHHAQYAGLAGKQQRFTHGGDVERHNDLIGHFTGLAVAVATDQGDVLTHTLQQRQQLLHRSRHDANQMS